MDMKKILMILGAVALASIAYFVMQYCEKKEIDNVKIQSTNMPYYPYNNNKTNTTESTPTTSLYPNL